MSQNADDYAYSSYIEGGGIPELYTPNYMTYSPEVKRVSDMLNFRLEIIRDMYKIKTLRHSPVDNSKLILYYNTLKKAYEKLRHKVLCKIGFRHRISNHIIGIITPQLITAQLQNLNIMNVIGNFNSYVEEVFSQICNLSLTEINNLDMNDFISDLSAYVNIDEIISHIKLLEQKAISSVYQLYRSISPNRKINLTVRIPSEVIPDVEQYSLLISMMADSSRSMISLSQVKRQYLEVELFQKLNDAIEDLDLILDSKIRKEKDERIVVYNDLVKKVYQYADKEMLKYLPKIIVPTDWY